MPCRYYKESHKILGQTYGMCVLQDFEAITPNLLARTIETVEGGGIVVILLKTMSSLRQLYTMTMVSRILIIKYIHSLCVRTCTRDTERPHTIPSLPDLTNALPCPWAPAMTV